MRGMARMKIRASLWGKPHKHCAMWCAKQRNRMDASKIIKIKQRHPSMTDATIIKQVPSVIENPIIIMESKTVPGRITIAYTWR